MAERVAIKSLTTKLHYICLLFNGSGCSLPFGIINPPSKKMTINAADPNVLAMTMSRARAAMNRKRPNAI